MSKYRRCRHLAIYTGSHQKGFYWCHSLVKAFEVFLCCSTYAGLRGTFEYLLLKLFFYGQWRRKPQVSVTGDCMESFNQIVCQQNRQTLIIYAMTHYAVVLFIRFYVIVVHSIRLDWNKIFLRLAAWKIISRYDTIIQIKCTNPEKMQVIQTERKK